DIESFTAQVKIDIGNALVANKNMSRAITQYREAFKLGEKIGNRTWMFLALWGLSKLSIAQGNYRESLDLAEQAIRIAEEASEYPVISQILVTAAKAHRNLSQPEEAYQALTRAINLIEHLREQLAGNEVDRQRSFEDAVTPYQAI